MIIIKKLTCTAVVLLLAAVSVAQPYYKHRTFSIRDGLSADAISDMTQSADGMMWFATLNGLCNFDGYHFNTFSDNKGTDEILTTNRMFKVKANSQGNIWCITSDKHLYLFDTHTCKFSDVGERLSRKYGRQFSFRGVSALANGFTWVTCDDDSHSVFRIDDSQAESDEGLAKVDMEAMGIAGSIVKNIFLDADGGEWIVNSKAVMLYDRNFKNKTCYEMAQPVGRQLFFASRSGQLACYQHGATALTPISLPGMSSINCLSSVGDATLVVGTSTGIMTYDAASGRFTPLGAATDNIQKLFVDGRQRVWAITAANDILMFDADRREQRMRLQYVMPLTASAYNIFFAENEGSVWVIPSGYNICRYDEKTKQLKVAEPTLGNPITAEIPVIKKIFTDSQHSLWYITTSNKLAFVSFGQHNIGYHEVSKGHNTRAIYIDSKHQLWVGDEQGFISVYDRELNRLGYLSPTGHIQPSPCTFALRIYAFCRDSKGRFWIGTKGNGLYMLDDAGLHHYTSNPNDKTSISHNDIYCIDEDERHNIWIGTFGGGVNLLNPAATGELSFIHMRNELSKYPPRTSGFGASRMTGREPSYCRRRTDW